MTFAEYLIEELTTENSIWRNNWFGIINDFPKLFSRLMPSSVIFRDDLLDERKNSRVQDLLKGTAKRQGILAFMLIIMRMEEKDIDKAVEHINELHALRTQKFQNEQSASVPLQTSIQRLIKFKDYIFPDFNYESCSKNEMITLYQFLKNSFLEAAKSSTVNSSGEDIKDQGMYLNLHPFRYDNLPDKLKAYINTKIGETIYKEQFTKAVQINAKIREITLNVKSIVAIHDNPEAYKWNLFGFANVYDIA